MQTISNIHKFSIVIINNESDDGVHFINKITVIKLFNHNGNSFSVISGSSFVDYDGVD
jgi:hypothetical protein